MINEIVNFLHMVFYLSTNLIYPYIFSIQFAFDWVYLCIICVTVLSWTFFKGECFINYYIKKRNDPNYVMGSDLDNGVLWILINEKRRKLCKIIIRSIVILGFIYVLLKNSYGILPAILLSVSFAAYLVKINKLTTLAVQVIFGLFALQLVTQKLKIKI